MFSLCEKIRDDEDITEKIQRRDDAFLRHDKMTDMDKVYLEKRFAGNYIGKHD